MATTEEGRKELQELLKDLMIWKEDFAEIDRSLSRLKNEFNELYNNIDNALDSK